MLEFCFSELIFNLIFPFFNWQEIRRRGLKVAVAGVPKTIDNDIAVIYDYKRLFLPAKKHYNSFDTAQFFY